MYSPTFFAKVICWSGLITFCLTSVEAKSAKPRFVSLKVSSQRSTYTLGEIVKINTSIRNKTSKAIFFGTDVKSSSAIQISFGGEKNYKYYSGATRNFMLDGINIDFIIAPQSTLKEAKDVFWSRPSSAINLTPHEPYLYGRIANNLAFPISGKYFVRLVSHVEIDGVSANDESSPIVIDITEPVGADIAVWEEIQANSDIAYFVQYGEPEKRPYDRFESDYLQLRVQKLISRNPTGIYVGQLQQCLHKFRLAEEQRLEFVRKYARVKN